MPTRPLAAGQEVFHSRDPGQPAGMVVNAAPNPARRLRARWSRSSCAALDAGSLHVGSADGAALQQRELPYVVLPPTQGSS